MDLLNGILVYLKLETNANSEVGSRNFTATNVSFSSGGKIGSKANFGTSANKLGRTDSSLNLSQYSINMWIKGNWNGSTREVVYSRGNTWANGQGLNIFLMDGGALGLHQGGSYGGGNKTINSNVTSLLTTGNWHMLTVTYDGTNIRGYINGNLVGTVSSGYNSSTAESRIGLRGDGSDYYRGEMDEFAIWNRAINTSEITALYNSGSGFQHPFTSVTPNNNAIFPLLCRK